MKSTDSANYRKHDSDFNEAAVAYVRPVKTEKGQGYAICNGDGNQLAIYATREAAFYAAKQHQLEPHAVH
jgi:hypothetical protein